MHLHDFLSSVHEIVQPKRYLEIGVQHGYSLARAWRAMEALGVDPEPLIGASGNMELYKMKSDDFFDEYTAGGIDFGFIDGLHHAEQALRDYLNMERQVHQRSVIIFDDVLPRNQEEARRHQCPGDWTGDVWKVIEPLERHRQDLYVLRVNTQPTGTLVVFDFPATPRRFTSSLSRVASSLIAEAEVPDSILNRDGAVQPDFALAELRAFFEKMDQIQLV